MAERIHADPAVRNRCLIWTCAPTQAPGWGIEPEVVAGRRGLSLLAGTMLATVVGWALGLPPGEVRLDRNCPRCGGPHGKPQAPGGLHVSASHTAGLVAVALTGVGPVGIDVECITRAPPQGVVQRYHAVGERLPRGATEFYRWWTRKESVLKATGEGLYRDPAEVAVADTAAGPRLERYAGQSLPATMADLSPGLDHVGCVTLLDRVGVEVRSGPPVGQGRVDTVDFRAESCRHSVRREAW